MRDIAFDAEFDAASNYMALHDSRSIVGGASLPREKNIPFLIIL